MVELMIAYESRLNLEWCILLLTVNTRSYSCKQKLMKFNMCS